MNFALMFALALGIDYALFIVSASAARSSARKLDAARRVGGDDGHRRQGGALLAALTVLISLSAVMLVPSPAFRSMALGIMLSVVFVLAATLTLLPAVLAKLGPRVDKLVAAAGSTPASTARRASPRWGERLWRRPLALRRRRRSSCSSLLALPVFGLKTGMPSIKVVPDGDASRSRLRRRSSRPSARRAGRAPGRRAGSTAAARSRRARRPTPASPRSRRLSPARGGLALVQAVPTHDPSSTAVGSDDRPPARRAAARARSSAARSPRTTTSSTRSRRRRRS